MATAVEPSVAAVPSQRQIPIVCPGHTRPLAEVHFCELPPSEDNSNSGGGTGNKTTPSCLLVSACHDKMPMMRDGQSGDWIGTFEGHKGAVWSCSLDSLGYLAATASGDFSVKVWDAVTGRELYTFVHKHIVKTTAFSPDSKRLATGGHEGLLRVYALLTPEAEPQTIAVGEGGSGETEGSGKKLNITKLAWIDSVNVLVSGSDGKIRLWNVGSDNDTSTQLLLQTLSVDAEVRDMELKRLDDGRSILTVAAGDRVSFFDVTNAITSSQPPPLLKSHKVPIHFREEGGASLHPSGTKFVTGGSDLWVWVFDFDTGAQLECLKGHHGPVRCVRYAPDGKTYATGSEDGTIRLWKTDPNIAVAAALPS